MDEPKLQKLINKMKAEEAGAKSWLEQHLVWIIGALCFVMGVFVGHLM